VPLDSSFCIADQNNVVRLHAAGQKQAAVARPVEGEDPAVFEIRQLFWRAAVEGLQPDVIKAATMIDISQVAPLRTLKL